MSWQGIEGHDDVAESFRRAIRRGRLATTFLFVGPPGVGKRTFAEKLAQALLCQHTKTDPLEPCGRCPSCAQAAAGTHPDLLKVAKPKDKSAIPVELFIGPEERRMREGLCHDIALRPHLGGRKVAIIQDADDLNREGANCLLKVLEEPPPRSIVILIGASAERQLPTIRSRAQIVRFQPLPTEVVAQLLLRHEIAENPDDARRIAAYSAGSLERASEWNDAELWQFRETLLKHLSAAVLQSLSLAKSVGALVDAAGKEAPARRARLRQVLEIAAEFYRESLRTASGAPPSGDAELHAAATQWASRGGMRPEVATRCVDCCLQAVADIDRNANQTTLIECWADELSQLATGRRPATV